MVTTRGLEVRKGEERCWVEAEPGEREESFSLSVSLIACLCFSIRKSVVKSLLGNNLN